MEEMARFPGGEKRVKSSGCQGFLGLIGEGAEGVLDLRRKGLARVFRTTQTLLCTGATPSGPVQEAAAFGVLRPQDSWIETLVAM